MVAAATPEDGAAAAPELKRAQEGARSISFGHGFKDDPPRADQGIIKHNVEMAEAVEEKADEI